MAYNPAQENKEKISITSKVQKIGVDNPFYRRHHTEEWKQKAREQRRGAGNANYGNHYHLSEEARAKISLCHKGKKQSPESVEKRISQIRGRPMSDERKQRMSITRKGLYGGEKNPFYGKHHSQDTLNKKLERWRQKAINEGRLEEFEARRLARINRKSLSNSPATPRLKGNTPITKICKYCGRAFTGSGNDKRFIKRIYCSKQCVTDSRKGMKYPIEWCQSMSDNHPSHSGVNNGRWLGGISYYPYSDEFKKSLKEQIRVRDNYQCQLCGKPYTTEDRREFPVHHINYNKLNCDPTNLITLCDVCHTKTNSRREYYVALFTEMTRGKYLWPTITI